MYAYVHCKNNYTYEWAFTKEFIVEFCLVCDQYISTVNTDESKRYMSTTQRYIICKKYVRLMCILFTLVTRSIMV